MTPFAGRGVVERDAGVSDDILYHSGWRYTSIVHEQDEAVESTDDDFVVTAEIVTDYEVDESTLMFHYYEEGQTEPTSGPMTNNGDGTYSASIPGTGSERTVRYYMSIETTDGTVFTNPGQAPELATWSHFFGFDVTPPDIAHNPVEAMSAADKFVDLIADINDVFTGVETPQVDWRLNNQEFGPFDMRFELIDPEFSFEPTWQYTIEIPQDIELTENDVLEYRITSKDKSIAGNTSTSPANGYYRIDIEPVPEPLKQYYANFSEEEELGFIDTGDEGGLSIQQPPGFDNPAIHSEHPYANAGSGQTLNWTYQLAAPLVINAEDPFIRFDEIVLVEIGEPNTRFTDTEFWDYVIVEGQRLGERTWFRFIDGYDSNADPDWLDRYNITGGEGTPDLYRLREIDMLENGFFNAGDEVFIRFRMFSDPFATAWGWAIDNLRIQEKVVAVEEFVEAKSDFSVFPNPVENTLHLSLNLKQAAPNSIITVSDIHGRSIATEMVNLEKNNRNHTIDVSALPKGVYLVSIRFNKDDIITRKVVK